MSKMKLSFSLLLAIFLVGILSTAAFARGAYWGGLSGSSAGWTYKFINTSDTAKDFYVKVYSNKDNYTNVLYSSPVQKAVTPHPEPTGAASEYVSITIAPTDYAFENNVIYKFVLNDGKNDTETKYGVTTINDTNNRLYNVADTPDKVDVNGSGLTNAHHTGQPGVKAGKGGNTHGFYQNNTNSCASCHQTHTAADGEYLLFKEGTYSTCSACHDGTTGAYNAFATANEETPNEVAGTFNISTSSAHNGSLHQADGSLNVTAAPGGNSDPASVMYGGSFDCASCHTPHGAGSSAENNLALDPLGWGGIAYKALPTGVTMETATAAQKDALNGKLIKDLSILDLDNGGKLPTKMSTPFIVAKKTVAASDISTDKTRAGYLYYRAGVTAGQKVIQTYRWDGQKYVADYSLWLKASGHVTAPFENANTVLTGAPSTLKVIWRDGFAFGSAADVDAVTKATIALGIDVETTNQMASLYDSTNANYVYDSGTEMSKYCASCHVDYLSTTRGNETGTYTTAHRHATAQDRLTCVRCHFAHGSDAQIMKDANDETFWTLQGDEASKLNYLVDPNYSSALKRYTGMSVCYACHGQGEDFLSNPNNRMYQSTDPAVKAVYGSHAVDQTRTPGTALKSGQPGTVRGN